MRPIETPHGKLGWLRQRPDYLRMNKAKRWVTPYFVVQVSPSSDGDYAWRVGFTTSRKVGNAVMRNRARRRLREMVRHHLPGTLAPGHDVVFIARTAAVTAPFEDMVKTLHWAAGKLGVKA